MFLFVFKALFTEFCYCACAKKTVMIIRIRHTCVALIHKKKKQAQELISNLSKSYVHKESILAP